MESCPSKKQNSEKQQRAGNVQRKRERKAINVMENETARETETARGDNVLVMCDEGEKKRSTARETKWRGARSQSNGERERGRHRRRGGKPNGEATETKRERREGEVMCSKGERVRRRRRRRKHNSEMDGNKTAARG
ncbi:hypothetical protein ACOSP7_031867 [Xanthoceras sorbifolium]